MARSPRSSESQMPALLMRMSSDSTWQAAAWICAGLVTSRASGVMRRSGWASGWRVPAYTRPAPLARASSASARPMPRLAPVTSTVLAAMVICVPPVLRCSRGVSGQRAKARAGEQVGGLVVAGAGEVDDRLADLLGGQRRAAGAAGGAGVEHHDGGAVGVDELTGHDRVGQVSGDRREGSPEGGARVIERAAV